MILKNQTFIPRELRKQPSQEGFIGISHSFYRSAYALLKIAQQRKSPFSIHTLSSIVLFTATLESYFNETLTLNLLAKKYLSREILVSLRKGNGLSFHEKIRRVFEIYDKDKKGIETDGILYRDLVALGNLRNKIIHYNPDWDNIYRYPKNLEHILNRTHLNLENAGWITNFSNIKVGEWAKATVKNTLTEFSKISGAHNPFTDEESFKSTRWED